jgi:hypothetical protein
MAFGTTIERRDFMAKTSLRVVFTAQDAICPDGAQLMARDKTLGGTVYVTRPERQAGPNQRTMAKGRWIAQSGSRISFGALEE